MNKFLSVFLIIVNINISFALDLNSKFQYEDLHNDRKFAPAIPFAIPLAEGILEGVGNSNIYCCCRKCYLPS